MNNKNQYNFNNTEVKKKVSFRLFVVYKKKSPYYKKLGVKRKGAITYRGYFNRPDQGRGRLMAIYLNRYDEIKLAILYNDKTGQQHHSRKQIYQVLKSDK